ncbi:energy transducer TonB [Litoribrevibacter albus]|nr:energy transducer TonB [Litoribrevibacter albus]
MLCGLTALFVVVGLFLFMAQLANPQARYQTADTASVGLDMLRMRFDSDVQLRDRSVPPPPPPVAQAQTAQAVAAQAPKIEMPTLDVPQLTLDGQFELSLATPSLPTISAPSSAPSEMVVRGDMVMQRDATYQSTPQYPRRALQRGLEGYVVLEFLVNEEGRVARDSVEVIESKPEGMFEREARKAIFRSRYEPLIQNGVAVPFKNRYRYEFSLEK